MPKDGSSILHCEGKSSSWSGNFLLEIGVFSLLFLYDFSNPSLSQIVHKKTATALCLTSVKNEDKLELSKIVEAVKVNLCLL